MATMQGVEVTFTDGNTKFYKCTGYDLKNFTFKSGKETALYLFQGKGKPAIKLKKKKIQSWKVRK